MNNKPRKKAAFMKYMQWNMTRQCQCLKFTNINMNTKAMSPNPKKTSPKKKHPNRNHPSKNYLKKNHPTNRVIFYEKI